jgi:hypothetical protein
MYYFVRIKTFFHLEFQGFLNIFTMFLSIFDSFSTEIPKWCRTQKESLTSFRVTKQICFEKLLHDNEQSSRCKIKSINH